MGSFRFGIMGAADIANKFCNAVTYIEDCEIVAVASKSMERAKKFAENNGLPAAYDSYEKMLQTERPDAVYIAVTTNAHFELCMLCLKYDTPFLCEKTMCIGGNETEQVLKLAEEKNIFCMEAMWSRFLPAINQVREWCNKKRIGTISLGDINVGFRAPVDFQNRFYNKELGGGAALDLTVYCYEIMTYLIEEPILEMHAASNFSESGVDVSNVVSLRFQNALACLKGSIAAHYEEKMILYGTEGNICVPSPHFASEAYLYDSRGNLVEHFVDTKTPNGFIYEIQETIRCIQEGKTESDVVPHSLTLAYARVCDELFKVRG